MPKEFIKIDWARGRANMGCWYSVFKDNDHFIAYIASLKLSAYGATEKEAEEMLDDVVKRYMSDMLDSTEAAVSAELLKYGWKRSGYFRKKFMNDRPPVDKSTILRNFNLPAETQIKSEFKAA